MRKAIYIISRKLLINFIHTVLLFDDSLHLLFCYYCLSSLFACSCSFLSYNIYSCSIFSIIDHLLLMQKVAKAAAIEPTPHRIRQIVI